MPLTVLLILLFCSLAFADEIDWQSEEMLGNVVKGELGSVEEITIRYQKVDRELMGQMLTGVKLEWPHPTNKNCCIAKLVEETSGGIEEFKLEESVVSLVLKPKEANSKKLLRCWKLSKDKTEFTELKQCPSKKKSKKSN